MVEEIEDDGIEAELIRRGPLIRPHGLAEARYLAHMPRCQGSSANGPPLTHKYYIWPGLTKSEDVQSQEKSLTCEFVMRERNVGVEDLVDGCPMIIMASPPPRWRL